MRPERSCRCSRRISSRRISRSSPCRSQTRRRHIVSSWRNQRFTVKQSGKDGTFAIPCVAAGAGGYTKLGKFHKIRSEYPPVPLQVTDTLTLEQYDQDNFGFLRLEVSKTEITGTYLSAPYVETTTPTPATTDHFVIDVQARTVTTK
jgi:hypothetical protein